MRDDWVTSDGATSRDELLDHAMNVLSNRVEIR